MRQSIFFLTIFFTIIFCQSGFLSADDKKNNLELDPVELQLDDDVDSKLDKINLPIPNVANSTNSSNSKNGNGIVWGKSAVTKESKDKSDVKLNSNSNTNSRPNSDIRFVQNPIKNQPTNDLTNNRADNLNDSPLPKTATKVNQRYVEPSAAPVIPKPLPQPLPSSQRQNSGSSKSSNSSNSNVVKPSGGTYLLKSSRSVGSVDLIETLLEVTGDVKQTGNDSQKNSTEKLEVVAGFRYEERLHKSMEKGNPLVSVRQYNLAKAKMRIGKDLKTPELKDKTRTIVSRLDGDKVTLFSPNGSLRGEELLLVEDLPGNTLTLDLLLPNGEVKVGDSWRISDSALKSFLSVDAITDSRVDAVLTAIADDVAMVEMIGEVKGIYLGAETKMSVQAKYQFDLNAKRINWLGILIQEDRSIGHVGPGFNLVARLQVKISPIEKPQYLTDEFVEKIKVQPDSKTLSLKYDGGKGAWRFSHDRNWYVFQDDTQTTVLRRLHNGELVAQCNIADMGTVDIKTMTTLEKFKKEISSGLGKSFRTVVAADQYINDAGYTVYAVMIDGTVEDLPLRWIYNLITDQNGKQTVVVFVVEAKMLKVFGDSDDILLESYRMIKKD